MDTNILLESGTNELEILEFMVAGNYYGINVAKIREIISCQPLTPIPNSHANVEGAFSTRGETITVVNLARALGMKEKMDEPTQDMFLITNFNMVSTGFHVHGVVGIHRVNWGQIIQPDSMICNSSKSMITGIVNLDGKLVLILDFEAIVAEIAPDVGMSMSDMGHIGERKENPAPILFAEDSHLLSMLIYDGLTKAGYTNVIPMNNGLELWNLLQKYKEEGTLQQRVRCVITDIEMPQMDGHRLLKLVRNDSRFNGIPFILFSSLISEEMRHKGEELGADGQISKPEINQLIGLMDELIFGIKKDKEE